MIGPLSSQFYGATSEDMLTIEYSAEFPLSSRDIPVFDDVPVLAGFVGVERRLQRGVVGIGQGAPLRQFLQLRC